MSIHQHIIIGAGPAGLAMAGRMHKAGIPFIVLEASRKIANAWHNHYDRLHLHTVNQWSHLPHRPFPEDYPLYVSRKQLVHYFEDYAETFQIKPHFDAKVIAIRRGEEGHWEVHTDDGGQYIGKRVIIATGVNRIPNIPHWSGQEKFRGDMIHSVHYKNAEPYRGKRVLVVGMGNTGAELALDLSEHGVETYLSVRGPVSIVPRDLNGRPVQVTSKQLEKLPLGLGTWLGNQIRKVYFGNIRKYGLEPAKLAPALQLKQTGKTPVVDIGTMKAIKAGKIKVMKEIESFMETRVRFKNGEELDIDEVILATGYRAKVEDFVERGEELLDSYGYPAQVKAQGYHEGLYFLGFDNYQLGGILGVIYKDSAWILEELQKEA